MDSWIKKDLTYNWHPYTQMKDLAKKLPLILIDKAKGAKLYDDKGNFYYDTISSWWCNIHGHGHPHIKTALKRQLEELEHVLFAGFTHKPAIRLAEKLVSIAPAGLRRVFFSDDGSTAVETALKMSFQYWRNTGKMAKTKFVSLDYGYHGDTVGAMSVSGVSLFNNLFAPLFFRTYKAPSPYCYRCPMAKSRPGCGIDCIEPLEKLLENKAGTIAGLILEPMVLAAGGMIIYPAEYLKRAARLAKKYGAHLILDEVATGFGRTGRMFACEHAAVRPDFLCLSKGLTSGYMPLAATLTTEKIYRAFYGDIDEKKTFYHGHTYTANPLGCSAALASLELFDIENTLANVKRLEPVFHRKMDNFKDLPPAGDVRYIGFIGAIELVKNKKTKEPFDFKERIGLEIYKEGLKRKLILRPLGNIIYFYLPPCLSEKELQYITDNAFDVIRRFS